MCGCICDKSRRHDRNVRPSTFTTKILLLFGAQICAVMCVRERERGFGGG